MPGIITHLIVQQRLHASLRELGGENGRDFSDLLQKDICSHYAGFGSIGPDFLFFSLKEYGTPLDELVNFIFGVYDAFEPLIDFYEDNIEPIKDSLEDAVAAVDQALFQGLFSQLKVTADLANSTALNAVAVIVTKNIDLFYPFYPKVQQGAKEDEWYWFDFLHYRRTGRFCSTMWNLSKNDDDLRRYCLGYASHIGTDVVGHSFVNAIVGGPYRTHWHRHKLVENWIDARARNFYPDSASTIGCLELEPKDKYVSNGISGSYYYRLCKFPNGKLPQKLGKMFLKAVDKTYGNMPHPITFSFADLDTTYRLWLKWFERSTTIGSAVKPTPVPPPGGAASTLINDYVNGFPSFPGPGGGGGGFNIGGIFAAIFRFAEWLVDVVSYTFTWIIQHAADIVTLPYVEAIATLKWLLYQIQKGIYEIYDNLRFMLVIGGYIFPEPQDLAKSPWGQALLNTSYVHLTGGATADFRKYPRKQETHGLLGTTEHHLIYPGTIQEQPHAEPAPVPFHGVFPEAFISQGFPYSPTIEKLYGCIEPYGAGNKFTHTVDQNTWSTAQLGNALNFCARLISQRMAKLPNFNLDADRGYGWKTWRAVDPAHIETNNPVHVNYIDP